MGLKDSALMIHFQPEFKAEPIPIPVQSIPCENYVFVIANTCVVADKHVTAPTNYNLRVVECRLASALLSKKLGIPLSQHGNMKELLDVYLDKHNKSLLEGFDDTLASVEKTLHKSAYSREEIAKELGMSVEETEKKYVAGITIRANGFELYKRAKHVFSEAKRVHAFRAVTQGVKPYYSGEVLKDLGSLMDQSQDSCRDLFNCSCPELDQLTQICRNAGAFGSRLTGAGWGGKLLIFSLVAYSSRMHSFLGC